MKEEVLHVKVHIGDLRRISLEILQSENSRSSLKKLFGAEKGSFCFFLEDYLRNLILVKSFDQMKVSMMCINARQLLEHYAHQCMQFPPYRGGPGGDVPPYILEFQRLPPLGYPLFLGFRLVTPFMVTP